MTRKELAEHVRTALDESEFGNSAAVFVSDVTDIAEDDEDGFATFEVHVGGLEADIFYLHVYKE